MTADSGPVSTGVARLTSAQLVPSFSSRSSSKLPPLPVALAPREPAANGRSPVGWSLIGQQGFPVITVPAGFTTGAAMSLVVDEALVPALGLSPPNRAFPAATHVRGLLNHLAYGAAVALTAEAAYRLTGSVALCGGP